MTSKFFANIRSVNAFVHVDFAQVFMGRCSDFSWPSDRGATLTGIGKIYEHIETYILTNK